MTMTTRLLLVTSQGGWRTDQRMWTKELWETPFVPAPGDVVELAPGVDGTVTARRLTFDGNAVVELRSIVIDPKPTVERAEGGREGGKQYQMWRSSTHGGTDLCGLLTINGWQW